VKGKNRIRFVREHLFLLRERPVLLMRSLANYGRLILLRRPLLHGVEFAITYRCQARCRHCLRLPLMDEQRNGRL
jgi:hypothetical protein